MSITNQGELHEVIRPGRNRTGSDIGKALFVEYDSANGLDAISITNAESDRPVGVTMEPILNGQNGNLCFRGRTRCTAGGTIAAGARIAPGANGKAVAAGTGDASVGRNTEDYSLADGDIFVAEIDCSNPAIMA